MVKRTAQTEGTYTGDGQKNRFVPIEKPDMVNHPPHYTQGGVECIDAIEAALGREGFIAFLRGQVIKYSWRMNHKGNPIEDAKKTAWYQARLIKVLEG